MAYDPRWPERFVATAQLLRGALGDVALRIDHIGSTAVPGLAAKDVIDIQFTVSDIASELYRDQMSQLGFSLRPDTDEPRHRFFDVGSGLATTHIHVCEAGSEWERRHLLFRDYLRATPDEVIAYAALKRELAALHRDDRLAYSDAKTPFIRAAEKRSESWAAATGWHIDN